MHPINILSLNCRISFINVGKYKKEYRKAMELSKGGYLYLHITCGISTMRFERSEYYS